MVLPVTEWEEKPFIPKYGELLKVLCLIILCN